MDEYTISYELADLLPINIYRKNKDGIYCGCNQFQANMMRINSKDEVIGKTDFNFLPPNEALVLKGTFIDAKYFCCSSIVKFFSVRY